MINSIRAHLAEFGIVAPVGRKGVTELLHIVADPSDKRMWLAPTNAYYDGSWKERKLFDPLPMTRAFPAHVDT